MNMKKLLISLSMVVTVSAFAQGSSTPIYRERSLLNGWNLYITNGATIGPGSTNLFTNPQGQILFANITNVINGVSASNSPTGDAFDLGGAQLYPDALGDFTANTAIHVLINQTNLIPVAVTNAAGQWFVLTTITNSLPYQNVPAGVTGWPLAAQAYPTYMYPATTNLYMGMPTTTSTNTLVFNFQRGWRYTIGANLVYNVWDTTTNTFQFTYNPAVKAGGAAWAVAGTPDSIITNIPTAFSQGANMIRCSGIVEANGTGNEPSPYIINAISIGQPIP